MKRTVLILFLALLIVLPMSSGARNPRAALDDFLQRVGGAWKYRESADGAVRALYGAGTRRIVTRDNDAQRIFADHSELFRIDDPSQLRLADVERDESGTTYVYHQYLGDLPVAGGKLTLSADRHGRVVYAGGQYYRFQRGIAGTISAREEARRTASRFRGADGGVSSGTLAVVPVAGSPRPAWRFETTSRSLTEASWILYVDAFTPSKILRRHRTYASFDGTGSVYMENPVVTPALSTQVFPYLDASTMLSGKFARTYNSNFTEFYHGSSNLSNYSTASDPARNYNYTVSDPKFTEAMAYFHVNRVHDRWRSFGFNKLNLKLPILVNVMLLSTGKGFDNAFYRRAASYSFKNGAIVIGAGNFFENLGHDADVYYHEYGHAVLDRAKPGFFETMESNYPWAFHEGFSDISASALTGNAKIGELGLRERKTKKFRGRDLENNNRFPQNVILKGYGKSESHYTGLIAGGAWWDVQKQTGIEPAQRILYRSLAMLPDEMTFFDLRDAMVTADQKLNAGANQLAIESAFREHGIDGDDPGQPGTIALKSLKTALLDLNTFRFQPKVKFKRGDTIVALAGYKGTGLTPGYNLVGVDVRLEGPSDTGIFTYGVWDEVVNGTRTGVKGAWVAEIDTNEDAEPGMYTLTVQSRLGGTSQMMATKTVKFRLE